MVGPHNAISAQILHQLCNRMCDLTTHYVPSVDTLFPHKIPPTMHTSKLRSVSSSLCNTGLVT